MPASDPARDRLEELAVAYGLPDGAVDRLDALLAAVASEPASITAVRDPRQAADAHVADSLVALDIAEVRGAGVIADLGSGGGFPGLPLAVALPTSRVVLVESVQRKCGFLRRAVELAGLRNVEVVQARAEDWREGLGTADIVTARAVAPLNVLVEYAAPLLRVGGLLVAWKGCPETAEEADGAAAAAVLGLDDLGTRPAEPFTGSGRRQLNLYLKVSSTPNNYPRRAGMARKRPLQA